jgi:predicted metal-binding membrane protein
MMAAMGMAVDRPWTATDLFFTFAMWTVMMVGMMTGSAAPLLLLFAATRKGRGDRAVDPSVLMCGLGYVSVWAGFSALAAVGQAALQRAALLSPAMSTSSGWLTAAILIAAGAYQLTPFKGSCLTECRSPLGFLMSHWRDGNLGAYRMGMAHGLSCLGCCWALMCVLFAVGVMNLAWVALLTALVLIEKVSARGVIVSRAAGALMIVAGIYVGLKT